MPIVETKFSVCAECRAVLILGDPTGIDYCDEDRETARIAAIEAGCDRLLAEIGFGAWVLGTTEETDEHSIDSCECCGFSAHGDRHSMTIASHAPCADCGEAFARHLHKNADGAHVCKPCFDSCEATQTHDRVSSDTAPPAPTTETP